MHNTRKKEKKIKEQKTKERKKKRKICVGVLELIDARRKNEKREQLYFD